MTGVQTCALPIWAEQTYGLKFGQNTDQNNQLENYGKLETIDKIPLLIKELERKTIDQAIKNFNKLGYKILDIKTKREGSSETLLVYEEKFSYAIPHYQLSQGMYRSLSCLIFIQYLIDNKKVSTLLVDDIGEGLDYDRATEFGKLLLSILQNTNIQLIMASNDNFLLDVVDIKYWNILIRDKNKMQTFNAVKNKDKFRKFKFRGLDNFSLFTSDYLLK